MNGSHASLSHPMAYPWHLLSLSWEESFSRKKSEDDLRERERERERGDQEHLWRIRSLGCLNPLQECGWEWGRIENGKRVEVSRRWCGWWGKVGEGECWCHLVSGLSQVSREMGRRRGWEATGIWESCTSLVRVVGRMAVHKYIATFGSSKITVAVAALKAASSPLKLPGC